jgi:ketosteroid isomerase-like protein
MAVGELPTAIINSKENSVLSLKESFKVVITAVTVTIAPFIASGAFAENAQPSIIPDWAYKSSTSNSKEFQETSKDIEDVLKQIEEAWNSHNLESLMTYYADDYLSNDGLDKKGVESITQDIWKDYPDVKSTSTTTDMRIEGNYATIYSRDLAVGSTAKALPEIGGKGELQSLSEGQLYLKKVGTGWKIIGDRIDYEKTKLAFGLSKQLNADFTAPEQIKGGSQYTAKVEMALPPGLAWKGIIISQPLEQPLPKPNHNADQWRNLETNVLERVIPANKKNHNELLTAIIGVTDLNRRSLMGVAFYTRRINVVPQPEKPREATQAATTPPKAETKAPQ